MHLNETPLFSLADYNTWLHLRRMDYPAEPHQPPATYPAIVVWYAGPNFLAHRFVYCNF